MKKIKIRKIINKLILIPLTVIFVVFINPIIFIILFILSLDGLTYFYFINLHTSLNPKLQVRTLTKLPIEKNSCNVLRFENLIRVPGKNYGYRFFVTLRLYGDNYQKILNILPTNTAYKPLPLSRTKKLPKELVEDFGEPTIGDLKIDDFLFNIKKGYYRFSDISGVLTIVVIDTEKQLVHVQCIY